MYSKNEKEIFKILNSNIDGLDSKETEKRLKDYGQNIILNKKKEVWILRFLKQFNDTMIIILLVVALLLYFYGYFYSHEYTDTIVILFVVFINTIVGFIQEEKASLVLKDLKKYETSTCKVKRDDKIIVINTKELVPGDIIYLESGETVPADIRILSCESLKVDESALTGESIPVQKSADDLKENLIIQEQKNMLFLGTNITNGKCTGIVVSTGKNTEIGKIALSLNEIDRIETPLQLKIKELSKKITFIVFIILIFIFILALINKYTILEIIMLCSSLAVAAIPEGLPTVITITLSVGISNLAKKKTVVKQMQAVETLGAIDIICSDKTGTITQNKMTVTSFYTYDEKKLIRLCSMCCDCDEGHKSPTESAILAVAKKHGFDKSVLDKKYRRIDEIPFDSTRKRMTTMHRDIKGYKTIIKGALEFVLPLCTDIYNGQKAIPLTSQSKRKIVSENSKMTSDGLRVIAVCYRDDYTKTAINENNMVFIGLIGIEDPPRKEAKQSVELCKRAGIRPVMITGDHAETALSVAKKIGIADDNSKVMTGDILEKISDNELALTINQYNIFARVTPSHKMKIVKALKANGEIVAMTGDGVNDAPALSAADIGCSMGITGTDVAKSASDMVLTDDNFATIIYAVREGRSIFSNIKKAVQFLLSSNIGEILTVFSGIMFGWSSPLTAIQLLWVNLVTDSLPAIALGLDTPDNNIMDKPPRSPKKGLFADGLWLTIIFEGLMIGALALLAFTIGANIFGGITAGRTMAFAVLSISQLVHAFNMRSEHSVFKAGIFKNPYLVLSLISGLILEVSVISVPYLANIFGVVPLNAMGWIVVTVLSVMPLIIVELQKFVSSFVWRKD